MPFTKLLSEMVRAVEGGQGAIFMDGDCEYVQYYGHIDSFQHKLLGAYQGILLAMIRRAIEKLKCSGLDKIVTEYEHARFVTKILKREYFLVLVMKVEANLGQALQEIDRTAEILNQEIA